MELQTYKVRDPSGAMREIRGPSGASDAEVIAKAQELFGNAKPITPREPDALDNPNMAVDGMGSLERGAAGAGAQISDMWDGLRQMVGSGPSSAEVKEKRALNAPLDATTAGKVGRFAGAVIPAAATSMIPGANTYTGTAATSAILGALEPVTADESRLKNTAIAAGTGVLAKAGTDKVANMLASRLANKTADLAAQQSRNSVKDATLQTAQEAGYVVPPSATNPSFLNKRLESIGGKAALGQDVAIRNQEVTNQLARRATGLADDAPITEGALDAVRKEAGKAYQAVAALDPRAASALERLKEARAEAKVQWNFHNRSGDPGALKAAKAADMQSEMLERVIEKSATKANRPELVDALKDARRQIAKTYDVERALNLGTGDVSAPSLGRALDRGAPLSGELETVGRFQQAFPAFSREGEKVPAAGVSKSEAITSAILATMGYGAGGPVGLAAGALPLLSGPARSMVLSKPYQAVMAGRSYAPGALTKVLPKVAGNELVQSGARAALIDAILANSQQ